MRLEVLDEPNLIFGSGGRSLDPKLGLLSSGPCGLQPEDRGGVRVVRAGAVASIPTLASLRQFLLVLRRRISPESALSSKPWLVDFPGLGSGSPLRFDVRLEEDKVETIWREEEETALAPSNRRDRIENVVQLYERKIATLIDETGAQRPEVLLLPISHETMRQCKDPSQEQDKIVYLRRTMERTRKRPPSDFPPLDFHNVLKVLGMKHSIPVQVIRPTTLALTGTGLQDPATIAWNFSVAAFYKGTGSPWKLAELDEKTCHVGISFYVEVGEDANLRAAMAQVYLRTGESQVIRGRPFHWKERQGRSPVLAENQAGDLLRDVIALYEDQWRKRPSRIVVHKRSRFLPQEIAGFESAAQGVDSLDLVHVFSSSSVRLYHLDKECSYPPLRGTLLSKEGAKDGILYTNGFVKALGTYPGSSVPWGLRFSCDRLSTDVRTVAADIMALTKLDWNNSNFSTGDPVTLSVAQKVGEILSETRARRMADVPHGYRFYM